MKTMDLNDKLLSNSEKADRHCVSQRGAAAAIGFAMAMLAAGPAVAGPTGGEVVAGDASISQSDTLTRIDQGSLRVAINWETFNVAADETVRFVQPSSDAVALNRIFDQNPSQIFGVIDANGRVLLINPNGLVFGESAQVNVAGLVASSLDMSVEDFMSGSHVFESGGSGGLVLNQGTLAADSGGFIALLGEAVANEGLIVADAGTVAMGSGSKVTLDFDGSGLILFEVQSEVLDSALGIGSAVSNAGSIYADGGQVLLTAKAAQDVFTQAINNEGLVQARRIENDGGVIRLTGSGGDVYATGTLDASGGDAESTGGMVQVLGDRVALYGSANVDVSGDAGGGLVQVGGAFQGADPNVMNASDTFVGADAQISADARVEGDGGEVIVWADNTTNYHGTISARGAGASGNAGFAEVSGKESLAYRGTVDLTADNGDRGTLLLDPATITIEGGAADGAADGNGAFQGDPSGTPGTVVFGDAGPVTVYESEIEAQSQTADIVLQATNSIVVGGAAFDNASGNAGDGADTLALAAGASLTLETRNSGAGEAGAIDLVSAGAAGAGLNIVTSGAGTITVNSGVGGDQSTGIRLPTLTSASTISVNAGGGAGADINLDGAVSGGAVDLDATGDININGTVAANAGTVSAVGANVNVNANVTTTGAGGISLQGGTVALADAITLSTTNQSITLIADTLTDGATTAINAGTDTVTLAPLTVANTIGVCDQGGADGCTGNQGATEYDLGDLDVTAGTLQVGRAAQTGDIQLLATTLGGGQTYDLSLLNGGAGSVTVADNFSGQGLALDSGSGGITLDGNVTTSGGDAIFADNVTLTNNVTIDSSGTTDGNVDFQGTVDGNDLDLAVAAGAGTVTLGSVGQTNALSSLNVSGGTVNLGGDIDTIANAGVVIDGAKNLTADVTITTTNDLVDLGTGAINGAQALTIAAGTNTVTLGAVGQGTALTSLDVTGGTINLGGGISTTGAAGIVLSGAKNLNADVTLATTNGLVDLDTGAINGAQALVVNAGTGTISLDNVGQGTALTSLNVAGGTINLGGSVTTNGAAGIVLSGEKLLTGTVTLNSSGNLIDLDNGAINGGQALTAIAGAGTVSLGDVGQTTALTSISASGGTINLNGDISTTGAAGIVLNGAKNLTADVTLSTTDDQIDLDTGTINGPQALTLDAGTGTVSLNAVGQTTALTALNVTGAGTLNLIGDITTNGANGMDFVSDAVVLGANVDLLSNNSDITFATDDLDTSAGGSTINAGTGTVALAPGDGNSAETIEVCDGASCTGVETVQYDVGGLATVTAGQFQIGRAAHTGSITLNTANPGFNLSLENGGAGSITVAGAFTGSGLALNSGSGGINLNANVSTAGGDATFADDVTLGGGAGINVDTAGGDVDFLGDINGGEALTVTAAAGGVTLNNVGIGAAVDALSVSGGTIGLGGDITANGNVTLTGTKTLSSNVTINSSGGNGAIDLTAGSTVDTVAENLVLTAGAGQISLGAVNVDSLSATTTGTVNLNSDVTTVGATGISVQGSTVNLADAVNLVSNNQPITLTANTLNDGPTSSINAGSGTLTLRTLTAGNSVAVCAEDAVNGCAAVADTEYDLSSYDITTGGFEIGQASQTGAITIGALTLGATQTLTVESGGTSSITLAGTYSGSALSLDSGSGGINVNGNVNTNGGAATFADDVTLGGGAGITVASANGDVDFQGDVDGGEVLTVIAGTGGVTLGNVGTGTAVDALSVSGSTISLGGNITANGSVALAGAKTLTSNVTINSSSGNGEIDLSTGDVVDTTSEDLVLTAGSGNVTLADVSVNTLDLSTTGTATLGAVTNSGDIAIAGGLINANGALSGNNVGLSASGGGISLPQVTAGGTLTVQAAGTIGDNATLDVTGNASFTTSTGDVTLDDTDSTFGSLIVTADNATITENDGTDLAGADVSGDLTITSAGAIVDTGTLTVGGTANLSAAGGAADITLDNGDSTFGTIALNAANALLTENDSTDLGASNVTGTLTVNSGGAISDSGALSIGGLTTLNAAGDITLDQGTSTFGSLSISGTSASITENDSMTIADADVSGGGLTLVSAGAIDATGTVQAGSLSSTSVGGATFNDAGNAVGTFTAANNGSGDVSMVNTGDLNVTGISQAGGGATSVVTTGSLALSGDVGADGSVALEAGTSMDQSADITSGGAVTVTAASGITMANGTVTDSSGGNISYTSTGTGNIVVGTLQTCPDCSVANSTGDVVVDVSNGNIIGEGKGPNQAHITARSAALIATAGSIGTQAQPIVLRKMSASGNARNSGAPIFLNFSGNAFVDSEFGINVVLDESANLGGLTLSTVLSQGQASSDQAATLEREEEVDWAAYSEDITLYEINNEGVRLPEEEEEDEFVRIEGEGVVIPIARNQ